MSLNLTILCSRLKLANLLLYLWWWAWDAFTWPSLIVCHNNGRKWMEQINGTPLDPTSLRCNNYWAASPSHPVAGHVTKWCWVNAWENALDNAFYFRSFLTQAALWQCISIARNPLHSSMVCRVQSEFLEILYNQIKKVTWIERPIFIKLWRASKWTAEYHSKPRVFFHFSENKPFLP